MAKKKNKKFKRGDVLVWDSTTFNPEWWDAQSEEDRIKWYGVLGYGCEKTKLFVFLTEIKAAPGHCVLVSLEDQHIETMRHTCEFRRATDEEV